MRIRTVLAVAALVVFGGATVGHAIPQLVNFQGVLTDGGGTPITVTTTVQFRIWDMAAGGTELWTESQSVTPDANGQFAILLGSVNPIPSTAFDGDAYLGLTISPDPELVPRFQLVSVGYSYRTGTVNEATGGNITTKLTIGPGHTNPGLGAFCAGAFNNASGSRASVTGGVGNTAEGDNSAIAGGENNETQGLDAFIGSGFENHANNTYSVVVSGETNDASGQYSFIGSGIANTASGTGAVVGGGDGNIASGERSVITGGIFNWASGSHGTIGGGGNGRARGNWSVVAGGGGLTFADSNFAGGDHSVVSGGSHNTVSGNYATVSGGQSNVARGDHAVVAGGGGIGVDSNAAIGNFSTVGGGQSNTASGRWTTAAGGRFHVVSGEQATVGGGNGNTASGINATVGGGGSNSATGEGATVSGGGFNTVSAYRSTVGGGQSNEVSGSWSTVSGGSNDSVRAAVATICGGDQNRIDVNNDYSNIAGGLQNLITGPGVYATIGGGFDNAISGTASCIPGGTDNHAAGHFSFASGIHARADHDGTFVWSDASSSSLFATTGNYQFLIRATGYVGINTNVPTNVITVPNINSTAGRPIAYAWDVYSSRRWKKNITTISDALDKVEKLRGVEFDSKSNDHHDIGLIAEEVGAVVPEVVTFEENGVDAQSVDYSRLVALLIQGMKEQQTQIASQQHEIDELRSLVESQSAQR